MKELNLDMSKIVTECFDGASNMKGENKGLATRMKVTSPISIYIHCYGHLINLALQDTLENVPVVRNTLGIIQSLYNVLEASLKRHAIFEGFGKDEGKSEPLLSTLKSQSVTRWSCHSRISLMVLILYVPATKQRTAHVLSHTHTHTNYLIKRIFSFFFACFMK